MKREGDERVGKTSQTSAKKRGRDGRQKTSNGTLKPFSLPQAPRGFAARFSALELLKPPSNAGY